MVSRFLFFLCSTHKATIVFIDSSPICKYVSSPFLETYFQIPSSLLSNPAGGESGLTEAIGQQAENRVVIIAIVTIGILISFVLAPKMKPQSSGPPAPPSHEVIKIQKKMGLLGLTNMFLGIAVLLLTALARA